MSSIIKLRKPDEIKFSDDNYDKPIGDDMERLLAETLASRERELEHITKGKEDKDIAEKWINPNSTTAPANNQNNQNNDADRKKKVSFNHIQVEHEHHEHVDEHEYEPASAPPNANTNTNTTLEINTLFNKFKKINTPTTNNQNNNQNNNNNLMIQMSEDIAFIKKSIIELVRSMSGEPK